MRYFLEKNGRASAATWAEMRFPCYAVSEGLEQGVLVPVRIGSTARLSCLKSDSQPPKGDRDLNELKSLFLHVSP